MIATREQAEERLRRWRLALGGGEADGTGYSLSGSKPQAGRGGGRGGGKDRSGGGDGGEPGGPDDAGIDRALEALYGSERKAGLGPSAPSVPAWLGDIRKYFPETVVAMLQKDALERLDLKRMLTEPELLEAMVPDVSLVATLMSLRSELKGKVKETARIVVKKVVDELMKRLETPMRQAVGGALNRASTTRRPRHAEIDWPRTIRANLKHWQEEYRTVIPETRIGFGRRRSNLKDVILLIDQSGSMAESIVYSSIFGAVMASVPALRTRLVLFDTAVLDLTDDMADPVEILFSVQMGGGTDINRAMAYGESRVARPQDTVMVLISDLIEGGVRPELLARAQRLHSAGVTLVVLLALSDNGAPSFDREIAAALASMGIPVFACTPDVFPEMMAAAIRKDDMAKWASGLGIARAA